MVNNWACPRWHCLPIKLTNHMLPLLLLNPSCIFVTFHLQYLMFTRYNLWGLTFQFTWKLLVSMNLELSTVEHTLRSKQFNYSAYLSPTMKNANLWNSICHNDRSVLKYSSHKDSFILASRFMSNVIFGEWQSRLYTTSSFKMERG